MTNSNPYELEYEDKIQIPALTRKNADFIKGIIKWTYRKKNPSKGFDPENHYASKKKESCGTAEYWFEEMKKPNADFRKCVLGAIIAIDTTNKTHLEASKNGSKIMRKRICGKCKNYNDLVNMLNIPFSSNNTINEDHLISLLTKGVKASGGKKGYRYNISFASKFCAYASIYLNSDIKYSKYDNIVSDHLHEYYNVYLNQKQKQKNATDFKISNSKKGKQHWLEVLEIYDTYSNAISNILKEAGNELTREEFDNIVWFYFKS